MIVPAVLAIVFAVGMTGVVKLPWTPTSGGSAGGDTATFAIGGSTTTVTEHGNISLHIPGAPQVSYSGPLGCRGQAFHTTYGNDLYVFLRYSAHHAYLLIGSQLYTFGDAPRPAGGWLNWAGDFSGERLAVSVKCPLPSS